MDSIVKLYMERAENEIALADIIFLLSSDESNQKIFKLEKHFTFYSSVITHAYYAIFYSAKAALLHIFSIEKSKRGEFTYQKLPQANKEPASESLENSKTFFKHINAILEKPHN